MKLLRLFNISVSNSFADVLAQKLLNDYAQNPLELSDVMILLPNRRACKTMADAFVRHQGMRPTLLPQLMPIADVDEDELVLQGAGAADRTLEVAPAINPVERTCLFMKIILSRPQEFGANTIPLNQACYLAQELGKLIDTVNNEQLDFADLRNLVPEEYAGHWQETLKFLEIITAYWPQILQERGVVDASLRRCKLIFQQAELWRQMQPQKRIIAAGITATFPAMIELLKTVAELPNGEVVFCGLDKYLDEEAWGKIDESHPQFELKSILDSLQAMRSQVVELAEPVNAEREKLISEIMRPAVTSDEWRHLSNKKIKNEALAGIHCLDCMDIRQEALAIAVLMRETLETPEKTAALITPDRNLARRVAVELERWDIKVDDSAGRPLSLTPWGIFMRLAVAAAKNPNDRIAILSLLKNPLCGLASDYGLVRSAARNLEKNIWRAGSDDNTEVLQQLVMCLKPLAEVLAKPLAGLQEIITAHIAAAENLAAVRGQSGKDMLWRGDAGSAGANLLAQWLENASVLGAVNPQEYDGLFEAFAAQVMVRPRYGTHPRLKILGPIEAKLNHFDVMILGEVNEGIWPAAAEADPWMSRPMKRDFGFPQPEKAIGVLAAGLEQFMGAANVYLTRAARVEGTPMIKSRWRMRLETVEKALGLENKTVDSAVYAQAAKDLDEPVVFEKIKAPAPTPPVSARPRELSASGVELLMRDPYGVYAKYILRLKKLDDIEPELTMADFGTILHGILEEFNNKYPNAFPSNAKEELMELGRRKFLEDEKLADKKSFWWPKFAQMIEHLAELESEYRNGVLRVHNEVEGRFCLEDLAGGRFTVTAKADRVDETKDGKINIIDYKTGKARSVKEVSKGFAPQLPLEGLIAEKGGFSEIKAAEVESMRYWQLGKKEVVIDKDVEKILEETEQRLKDTINIFDFETTPYVCQPNPKHIPEYSDYEHLARVKEWYVNEEDDD